LSAIGVTPTRPETDVESEPVKPGDTWKSLEPLALASPCTSLGATTCTGRTATGMRTRWVPSFHVSEPFAQAWNAASVRVKVTVKDADSPGCSVSVDGVTDTSKPGTPALAV